MFKIGIDASRSRSGGARAHLIGIISEVFKSKPEQLKEIHIWSYPDLLSKLPDCEWIIKHSPKELMQPLIFQLYWQFANLQKEAKRNNIDIMLNTNAGTVCAFQPSVTMSRDMLSYEKGEMQRYRFGFQRLRLELLKLIQNRALRKSTGVIFLTNYASKVIQQSSGKLKNVEIINHGVSNNFRIQTNSGIWKENKEDNIRCVYISNMDLYKHQWNVALAIEKLREKGYKISIDFIGGGTGLPQKIFDETKNKIADSDFISQIEFLKHDDLPLHLRDKDIFVFASSCENMPNTLIEGMCTGLPIACSNRGPMPEILQDGGVYFDPENIDSIVNALEAIIINGSLRKKIAEKSKKYSKKFYWEKCSKETFSFLIKTLNRNKKIK